MKIVWFLLGFAVVSALMLQSAHAICTPVTTDLQDVYRNMENTEISEPFADFASAYERYRWWVNTWGYTTKESGGGDDTWYIRVRNQNGTGPIALFNYVCIYVDGCGDQPDDSDGDGIPDYADAYPDDETPYMVRKVAEFREWGELEVKTTLWETDRGDFITTGQEMELFENPVQDDVFDQPWQTPEGGPLTDDDFPDLNSDDDKVQGADAPDPGSSIPDPVKTDSDPADTEAQSGQKTVDNTGKIVDAVNKTNKYAKSLNDAVAKLKGTVAAGNTNTYDIEKHLKDKASSDTADAQAGKTQAEGFNVADYYNPTSFSGTLEEGTDYQPADSLTEQGWFSDFLSSNPYKTALDGSGFECTGAVCELTLQLPAVLGGSHKMSICQFDQQFQSAGTMLLSLTTLGGFVMLARG